MAKKSIHQPHDKLFKSTFGEPANATGFLRGIIPAALADVTRPFIPDFTFRLIQLADLPFDKILGTPAGIITLRVMKAERIAKLLDDPVWDEALMIQLPREIREFIIRDILDAGVDKDAFDHKIARITQPEIQSSAMTIAQQFRQEGRQEGLWVGKILALEELMGLAPTDAQALAPLAIPELERRYELLRREYDTRFRR